MFWRDENLVLFRTRSQSTSSLSQNNYQVTVSITYLLVVIYLILLHPFFHQEIVRNEQDGKYVFHAKGKKRALRGASQSKNK
jgi:hypothetical protein